MEQPVANVNHYGELSGFRLGLNKTPDAQICYALKNSLQHKALIQSYQQRGHGCAYRSNFYCLSLKNKCPYGLLLHHLNTESLYSVKHTYILAQSR